MKNKYLMLWALLLTIMGTVAAQEQKINYNKPVGTRSGAESKGFDKNRLIYGGGFMGGMNGGSLAVGISPITGYRFNDYLSAGISLGYQYNRYKNAIVVMHPVSGQFLQYNLNYHIITPGIWGRLVLFKNFFIHTELEYNITNYNNFEFDYNSMRMRKYRDNITVPCLLVGGGIRQPIGENASFVMYALYDVLQNIPSNQATNAAGQTYSKSPYVDRVDIRLGINIGF
jgi:hypothetical protein